MGTAFESKPELPHYWIVQREGRRSEEDARFTGLRL